MLFALRNTLREIGYATGDYMFIVGDILKDIPRPWDPPMMDKKYFDFNGPYG